MDRIICVERLAWGSLPTGVAWLLLTACWLITSVASYAVPPPFEAVEVPSMTSPMQNRLGDLVTLEKSGNSNYVAYWVASGPNPLVRVSNSALITALGSDHGDVVLLNNAGDVLIRVWRPIPNDPYGTAQIVKWLLWRTARGGSAATVLEIPAPFGSDDFALNDQADLAWTVYNLGVRRTYFWRVGDLTATEISKTPIDGRTFIPLAMTNRVGRNPDSAVVVGHGVDGVGSSQAVFWKPTQNAQYFSGFPGDTTFSEASYVNSAGDVTGRLYRSSVGYRLWLYRASAGQVTVASAMTVPAAINAVGEVLTYESVGSYSYEPRVWKLNGSGVEEVSSLLPVAGTPSTNTVVSYFNEAGDVVGWGRDERNRFVPCLWKRNVDATYRRAQPLQACIPAHLQLGLSWVAGLNPNGYICGWTRHDGVSIGIQLRPLVDTDTDGLPDVWETANGTNPLVADAEDDQLDGDELSNFGEYHANTNPLSADTDGMHSSIVRKQANLGGGRLRLGRQVG